MAASEHLLDKRIVERSIARGKLDASEYQKRLEELPDRADNVWSPEETPGESTGGSADHGAPDGG